MPKSAPSSPAPVPGGIFVHLVCDVDEKQEERQISIKEYGKTFTAEELCTLCGKKLGIATLTLHLYALVKKDLSLWYPPNHEIKCEDNKTKEFRFRIRFLPPTAESHLTKLYRKDQRTFEYLYLQCRDDFVNERIVFKEYDVKGKKLGQEHLLGLGVIDMLRFGKAKDYELARMKGLDPFDFVMETSKKSFKNLLDKKRLSLNFKQRLETVFKTSESDLVDEVKLRYMRALFSYAKQYCMETFHSKEANYRVKIVVDPYDAESPGISCEIQMNDPGIHDKPVPEHFSKIEELMDVSIAEDPPGRVQINRKFGMPKVVNFERGEVALSFVALLDGYYRLREDFHHSLCRSIEAPVISALKRIRSHGPVRKEWVESRLRERNKASKECNYLLCQRNKDLRGYVLAYINSESSVYLHTIILREDGKYQLDKNKEEAFNSMHELLEYYRTGDYRNMVLNKCVPPSFPVDPEIYLCGDNIDTDLDQSSQNKHQKAQVSLVSDVNLLNFSLGEGNFTEVFQGSLDKTDLLEMVAVKQLKKDAPAETLGMFLQGVHQASFWDHPTLITIHSLCLSGPVRVVMEKADYGTLEQYLHGPSQELKVHHLIMAAEQLAQALCYLQEGRAATSGIGEVHDNIRSRNILVFRHDYNDGLRVKLGDPGMVHYYNSNDLSMPYNEERLAWIAPERYNKTQQADVYTDRYAFGITLWEMFAGGDRPFNGVRPDDLKKFVLVNKDTLRCPKACPEDMYELMKQSWDLNPENRPDMKEIVRNIRHILTRESVLNDYNDPHWASPESEQVLPSSPGSIGSCPSYNGSSALSSGVGRALADNETNAQLAQAAAALPQRLDGPRVPRGSQSSISPSISSEIGSVWDSQAPLLPRGSTSSSTSNLSPTSRFNGSGLTLTSEISDGSVTPTSSAIQPLGQHSMQQRIQSRPLPAVPCQTPKPKEHEPIARERVLYDKKEKPLGKGHYGEVYKGLFHTDSGNLKPIAIKCLKSKIYNKYAAEFEKEFKIMISLSHENIVNVIGQCPQRDHDHPMLLIMEFVENGCLREYLKSKCKSNKRPWFPKLIQFCREIATGMDYLSEKKIVHRDLAARNVLVTGSDHVKISDFGLSHSLGDARDYYRGDQEKDIPAPWCAPEALIDRKFSMKSDVWSYGITVWEIFSIPNYPELSKNIRELPLALYNGKRLGKKSGQWPQGMYDLILKCCWEYSPDDRADFSTLLQRIRDIETATSET